MFTFVILCTTVIYSIKMGGFAFYKSDIRPVLIIAGCDIATIAVTAAATVHALS